MRSFAWRLATTAALCGALGLAAPAFADMHEQGEKAGVQSETKTKHDAEQRKRVAKMRQVSGEILQTKQVEVRGTEQENLVALIKTNKGDRRLPVDLGPVSALQEINLAPGSKIEAEGRVVEIRDHQFMVAHRIQAQDRTLDISREAQRKQVQGGEKTARR